LPKVFDAASVAANEEWDDMFGEISDDGEFAAIEGGVSETVEAVLGGEFECDKIAARAADDDFGIDNFHAKFPRVGWTKK
jgi:hypothetical protein